MCGIYGVISRGYVSASLCRYVSDASLAGAVRGIDSSGLFQIDKSGKPFLEKRALSAGEFSYLRGARNIINDADTCPITIGHHRAATNGEVTDVNAHPFYIQRGGKKDYLIGVHNGSLTTWDRTKFNVDSAWALNELATRGVEALEDFRGPYVFVWYDTNSPNKLFIARGKDRPIHVAFTKGWNQSDALENVLIGSEGGMVSWLANRNGLNIKDDAIYGVEENTLLVLDTKRIGEFEKFPIKQPVVVTSTSTNHSSSSKPADNWRTEARTKTIANLQRIIQAAKKEIAGEQTSTPTDKVAVAKTTTSREDKPHVGPGSIQLARTLGVQGSLGFFTAKEYNSHKRVLTGEISMDDYAATAYPATMMGVDQSLADAITLADFCECRVLAATVYESPGSTGMVDKDDSVVLIIQKPTSIFATRNDDAASISQLLGESSSIKVDSSVVATQSNLG